MRFVCAAGFSLLVSCATTSGDGPHIRIRAVNKAANESCPEKKIDVIHGPVPVGAVEITAATSQAMGGMRAQLVEHEETAVQFARKYCADGVSVLSATESDGIVDEATLSFWRFER